VKHAAGGGETDAGTGSSPVSDRPVGAAQVDGRTRRGSRDDSGRDGVLVGPVVSALVDGSQLRMKRPGAGHAVGHGKPQAG